MRYRVGLSQQVYEEATIYVDASSMQEAEQIAVQKANAGEVDWQFLEANGDVEVVTISQE